MKNLFSLLTALLVLFSGFAQDQHLVDSLTNELKTHKQDTIASNILNELTQIYINLDPDTAMYFANKNLEIAEKIDFKIGIGRAYHMMGMIKLQTGEYTNALEFHSKALQIRTASGNKKGMAASYNSIGTVYIDLDNYPEALNYFFKALKINEETGNILWKSYNIGNIAMIYEAQGNLDNALKYYFEAFKFQEELGDKDGMAASYNNIGNIYRMQGKYTEALQYTLDAIKLNDETGNLYWKSCNLGNIGNIYFQNENYPEALKYYNLGEKIAVDIGDKNGVATALLNIGSTYYHLKQYGNAFKSLNSGLEVAKEIGSLNHISLLYKLKAQTDSAQADYKNAFEHHKLHILYRDSMFNEENTKKIVSLQMNYEFEKKEATAKALQDKKDAVTQKEIQKQRIVRNGFMGGFAIVLLFAGVFFLQRNKIKKEKKRSDELLLNILPSEVAEELKAKGSADAKQFDLVTVMFTDFKGFTQISEKLSPAELVAEIDTCFKAFDKIITKHNIEKIKTIGDSYMCAGGLPVANKSHADEVVSAALEIQKFIIEHLQQRKNDGKEVFEIRIGIHTGPIVAGIVGLKKFAYDIWGDTVNIASRMESSGEVGKINISGTTYELVKDKFSCLHRGKIEAKGKGEIDMYFVDGKI